MSCSDRSVLVDGTGIVAMLYALCELFSQYRSDDLAKTYHALRDFTGEYAEENAFFAVID